MWRLSCAQSICRFSSRSLSSRSCANTAYDTTLRQLVHTAKRKSKDWFDFTPFVVGVLLLKQFHSLHTQKFLSYLGQHVRCLVNGLDRNEAAAKNVEDYPPLSCECALVS